MVNHNLPNRPTESRIGRLNQRYSESGSRMVAGCICLNKTKDRVIMILLLLHPGKWVLPKGGIELDESDDFVVTAVRETWEEAGVEGIIANKLPIVYDSRGSKAPIIKGEFDPTKGDVPKSEFHFYELIVEELSKEWPESSKRERRWCTYLEAKHELEKANRPELVSALNLSSIVQDNEGY